ncbi:PII-like signaling protein [Streptomyces umbrinus]|uniref:PII-like signaling protein n=1 Tax=Streptomyces umbrinus TaxID=67370 RepID=A0ABU0T0Z7_9ACTN|nr:DUF190 domain-containing protein [Streptomyces umbrinus]MDQ1029492.1 PII-like signaling protein [Streptomyces umbrinus]
MTLSGHAVRATVFLSEGSVWNGRLLHREILERALALGLAGATASRGTEGFGRGSTLHTDRLESFADGLPIMITVIDASDRIHDFLSREEALIAQCVVVLDDVEVFRSCE